MSIRDTHERTDMTTGNDRIQILEDATGEFRWHRVAGNNEIIGQGEGYVSLDGAIKGARRANPDVEADQIELLP